MATKESNYVINLDVNTSKLTKALDKIRDLNTTDLIQTMEILKKFCIMH